MFNQLMTYISTNAIQISLVFIGAIGAWIAFYQARIAKYQAQLASNKLKLDLFNKRIAVYSAVRETLGAVGRHGKLTQDDEINYLVGTRSARWLFGPEVADYLDKTLWHKLCELWLHNSMMSGPPDDEGKKHILARAETMKWLMTQYSEFDALCDPYLTLKH